MNRLPRRIRVRTRGAVRQRGIAMFVALIGMTVLMLAAVALVRSVDTSTSVAGNIAFRQSSIAPVNQAVEQAVDALFKSKTIASQTGNDLPHGYYASLQAGERPNGVPAILAGDYSNMAAAYSGAGLPAPYIDPLTKLEVRWVLERICLPAVMPAGGGATYQYCDMLPPKVSQAGTDNKPGLQLPPIPNFRVTVRVDLPNTNTVSYAQAFLR